MVEKCHCKGDAKLGELDEELARSEKKTMMLIGNKWHCKHMLSSLSPTHFVCHSAVCECLQTGKKCNAGKKAQIKCSKSLMNN